MKSKIALPNLWKIRSQYNGNSLGCIEASTEKEALAKFADQMRPTVLDVYAEPLLSR